MSDENYDGDSSEIITTDGTYHVGPWRTGGMCDAGAVGYLARDGAVMEPKPYPAMGNPRLKDRLVSFLLAHRSGGKDGS